MNLDNDYFLEFETIDQEEELGETLEEETQEEEPREEPGETLEEETQEETQEEEPREEPGETLEYSTIDYSQDFIILENIGYFQLSLLGALVLFFIMSLVIKFIKSFF